MTRSVNIFSNIYKITKEIREVVESELKSHGFIINDEFREDADFNIVIGGDGTFIKAVHDSNYSEIPFVGINTGHLGFYNDVERENVKDAIRRVAEGDYFTNNLRYIQCKINTEDDIININSINELVLKAKYASVIHFNLYVDDVLLQSFAGDGVLFSTPSGSTAYNLSAGGAIMYQDIDAFQITPLAPIRSSLHKSLDKSLIVPKNTKIKLITRKREQSKFSLSVDGFHQDYETINYIDISLSEKTIQKIIFDKNWFWKNIKYKFI